MGILKLGGLRTAVIVACVGTSGALFAGPAFADNTIVVNTTQTTYTQGDGLCSLGEAVDYADGGSDPDCSAAARSGTTTIDLPAGKFEVPGTLELDLPTNLVGAGATSTDLDGGDVQQVVMVGNAATVTLSNLAVTGGNSGDSTAGCTGSGSNFSCANGEQGNNGGGIVNAGKLTLQGVTVSGNQTGAGTGPIRGEFSFCSGVCDGGNGGEGGDGGGIYNAGALTVDNSTISGNSTGSGGDGASAANGLTADGAGGTGGYAGDSGDGGGIFSAAGTNNSLTITNSTISDNTTGNGGTGGNGSVATASGDDGGAGGDGGSGSRGAGIYINVATLTVTNSTISGNVTGNGGSPGSGAGGDGGASGASGGYGFGGAGGGIYSANSTVTLTNDTIAANAAGQGPVGEVNSYGGLAGGLFAADPTVTLTDTTLAGNAAFSAQAGGGGIFVNQGFSSPVERNSIIASNTAPTAANCAGPAVIDSGHNIVYGDSTCPGVVENPKLGTLSSNGGPTQTLALLAGSPAIDTVPASDCAAATDQRGVSRPQGGSCDAGSYEVAPPTFSGLQAVSDGPASATVSGEVTANLTDTKLAIHYGTSTAYGSTTAATDEGSGSGTKAFAVTLTGLAPQTTYHVQLVATNSDGTSSSSDMTVSTPIAATASIPHATITGSVVLVSLSCAAGGGSCAGALKLSSRVTTTGGKVVAVAASAAMSKKPKRRTTTHTVGGGRYSVAAGNTTVLKLTLNAYGKRLLKARRRLPAMLTSTGSASISEKLTFISKRSRKKKR